MPSGLKLRPGNVLRADLIRPGETAVLVRWGTALTLAAIEKIRNSGLEGIAQDLVEGRRLTVEGISQARFKPLDAILSLNHSQHQAERVIDAAKGLRIVIYLVLAASIIIAIVSRSALMYLFSGVAFLSLAAVHLIAASLAEGSKLKILQLEREAEQARKERLDFLARLTAGDAEAVAEVYQGWICSSGIRVMRCASRSAT